MITSIAKTNDEVVVTRNVKDHECLDVEAIGPFQT